MKTLYKAEPVSDVSEVKDLVDYLRRELASIEQGFGNALPREIDWLHVAPTKVREGLTVGADGSDWNPGSGQGVYTYYNGAWNKLG